MAETTENVALESEKDRREKLMMRGAVEEVLTLERLAPGTIKRAGDEMRNRGLVKAREAAQAKAAEARTAKGAQQQASTAAAGGPAPASATR
jgi:hypothetical protein